MSLQIGIERGSVVASIDQTADVAAVTTTLGSVTGLTFEMEAGVKYVVDGVLYASSDAAAQDVKAGAGALVYSGVWEWITVPVGNTLVPANLFLTEDAIAASAVSDISGVTDVGVIRFHGVITSVLASTFQITAAQGTDAGTTTIANGHMSVRKALQ